MPNVKYEPMDLGSPTVSSSAREASVIDDGSTKFAAGVSGILDDILKRVSDSYETDAKLKAEQLKLAREDAKKLNRAKEINRLYSNLNTLAKTYHDKAKVAGAGTKGSYEAITAFNMEGMKALSSVDATNLDSSDITAYQSMLKNLANEIDPTKEISKSGGAVAVLGKDGSFTITDTPYADESVLKTLEQYHPDISAVHLARKNFNIARNANKKEDIEFWGAQLDGMLYDAGLMRRNEINTAIQLKELELLKKVADLNETARKTKDNELKIENAKDAKTVIGRLFDARWARLLENPQGFRGEFEASSFETAALATLAQKNGVIDETANANLKSYINALRDQIKVIDPRKIEKEEWDHYAAFNKARVDKIKMGMSDSLITNIELGKELMAASEVVALRQLMEPIYSEMGGEAGKNISNDIGSFLSTVNVQEKLELRAAKIAAWNADFNNASTTDNASKGTTKASEKFTFDSLVGDATQLHQELTRLKSTNSTLNMVSAKLDQNERTVLILTKLSRPEVQEVIRTSEDPRTLDVLNLLRKEFQIIADMPNGANVIKDMEKRHSLNPFSVLDKLILDNKAYNAAAKEEKEGSK